MIRTLTYPPPLPASPGSLRRTLRLRQDGPQRAVPTWQRWRARTPSGVGKGQGPSQAVGARELAASRPQSPQAGDREQVEVVTGKLPELKGRGQL